IDQVPLAYVRQLAAYAAAIGVIFPDRAIAASLLYTAGPAIIDLPPALIAAHAPGSAPPDRQSALE
ncbi:MAG: hypothetical protein GW859_02770, partial [Sphingomonadales bacterium]|nr:hypothetical protein [Sphingomonadales bacterium]